jgi:penicillin-binding protein 1A
MPKIAVLSRACLWLFLALSAFTALIGSAAFLYLSPNLPSVDVLRDVRLQTPLRIYSRDGRLIGEFGEMRRTPIQVGEVPPLFIKAVLAAEDDRFFEHPGVDITGLTRAASQLLVSGRIQTGGSTITMQVAKNYFLSYERTFSRKFNEILLALQIERELTKPEILELYLNKIFLGNRAYGVEAAAHVYYGKPISELNLSQWATLAGVPKAPSTSNPLANAERARQRRDWILGRMLHLDYIDQAQYQAALREPIDAAYHGAVMELEAGHVAEMVRLEMLQRFGPRAYTEGYVVHTTIDSELQRTASRAVVEGLLTYSRRHGYRGPELKLPPDNSVDHTGWRSRLRQLPTLGGLQAAAVLAVEERSFEALLANGERIRIGWDNGIAGSNPFIDENRRGPAPKQAADVVAVGDVVRVRRGDEAWEMRQIPAVEGALVSLAADTGAIASLVAGFDFRHSKFNRITQAQRQPVSAFKPLIYTAALDNGFTAATMINDAPIVFADASELQGAWRPVNDTGRFYGPTPLRQGLYKSRNVVSIRLLQRLGINRALGYLERFGFERDKLPANLSLALGSLSTTPLQMARSYAVFANGGYLVEPYLIQRVADLEGRVLFEANRPPVCSTCEPTQQEQSALSPFEEIGPLPTMEPELPEPVVDPGVAFIMDTMLRDVVRRGTAGRARVLERSDLAGKTGTTNGPTDVWFAGYAGGIVTTTWVGFDQYQQLGRNEYASSLALPIWIDYMRTALKGVPERHFRQPHNVISLRIDPATGQRAYPGQPDAQFEYFTTEHAPQQVRGPDRSGDYIDAGGGVSEQDLF